MRYVNWISQSQDTHLMLFVWAQNKMSFNIIYGYAYPIPSPLGFPIREVIPTSFQNYSDCGRYLIVLVSMLNMVLNLFRVLAFKRVHRVDRCNIVLV